MKGKENHNVEFKQAWQEKCMDTICAFANTNGGFVFIGKDDHGKVIGLSNSKGLMDEIPNKIASILGFAPDVRLKKEKSNEYIEIIIKPQSYAVSLRGKYYTRSGSSTLELKGAQLQNFLLQKSGKDWESMIEEEASIRDIKPATIQKFKALSKKRFPSAANEITTEALLEKLHLFKKNKPTKAAILLFGKNPQKFYKNAQFKIGAFLTDTDLKSTDVVEGNLFEQVEQIFELLKNKYLVYHSNISGLYRTEDLEYPEAALREAIINSIVHRDYIGAHTQLRLFPDKLTLWNYGELPSELSFEGLRKQHQSLPRNTKIADVFYKAGLIEAWGRGTTKMIEELTEAGLPEPLYENRDGGFALSFLKDVYTEEFLIKAGLNERQITAVIALKSLFEMSNQKYTEITGTSERTASRDLAELVAKKIVVQSGSTGKGTVYTLRRHKAAKAAITSIKTKAAIKPPKPPSIREKTQKANDSIIGKGATKGPNATQRGHKGANFDQIHQTAKAATKPPKPPFKNISHNKTAAKIDSKGSQREVSLDEKLAQLKEGLSRSKSKNEIRGHFNQHAFFKIYDAWLFSTLKELIIVAQKFNEFYTEPRHYIGLSNVGGGFSFSNEEPKKILADLMEDMERYKDRITSPSKLTLSLQYSTFKRTDRNRKTFGCNYSFDVEFSFTSYTVFLDNFSENGTKNRELKYERLLHEPLKTTEIKKLTEQLGDVLYRHIAITTKKMRII